MRLQTRLKLLVFAWVDTRFGADYYQTNVIFRVKVKLVRAECVRQRSVLSWPLF
jgi:hypothetical protein